MPSGAHNTGGMAITGMATIGIGVGAADGSAGGIAAAASAAGVDGKGGTVQVRSVAPGRPPPQFVRPRFSQPVEQHPSGQQRVHEIKLDAYRMAARIDNGRVQLLTRTGLDWTAKYPRSSDRVEPSRLATGPLVGFTRRVS
jgi:ATP-dependent DNA ligase